MTPSKPSPAERAFEALSGFLMDNRLVTALLVAAIVLAGLAVSPFRHELGALPRDPIPVDALPDIGENQQIVFTRWPGRSPRDVEDQITYPLSTALLGIPGVRSIRASSVFGFSSIYLIFEDDVEFYWSRSRVLEKLSSLPPQTLPDEVQPALGPDATGLGQVFWYTLEPEFEDGSPAPGLFDLHELRSIQDFSVRYALQAVSGVSEVASVGGQVREYQVDVDPEAMRAAGVSLGQIAAAVRSANLDVGARTLEVNRVEYVVRGLGLIEQTQDLEEVVVATREHTPIRVRDVAKVMLGPAQRRGALDRNGAPAVGGVVVVRYGDNPLQVIERVRARIEELAPGLPRRTADDGRVAQVKVVPFYDRTTLIEETLGTLSDTLIQQVLITIAVVMLIMRNLRMSLLVSVMLPLGVLGTFIAMRVFGVAANVMALSGIAIAIGTMVDMGIVLSENMVRHLDSGEHESKSAALRRATGEVAPAVLTAVLTTVLGFVPVFGLTAAEGKLFSPLAYTKTFALIAAFLVTMLALPMLAALLFRERAAKPAAPGSRATGIATNLATPLLAVAAGVALSDFWRPLGHGRSGFANALFVLLALGLSYGAFALLTRLYAPVLRLCLRNKVIFLGANAALLAAGLAVWLGVPGHLRGLQSDFMPPFDEGAFLYMPTTTPHASLGQALEMIEQIDAAIAAIPEVDEAIGKIGRAESPLDPAPVSMVETVVNYHPEFAHGSDGRVGRFRYDGERGEFVRDERGQLIEDPDGRPYRNWRQHIRSPDDIWNEITTAAAMPGVTGSPKLMPIETRLVMLQTGMRAPIGVKLYGPSLESLETFALDVERLLTTLPEVDARTVVADRIVGKPYLEIDIDREAIARYGLSITAVQDALQLAIGGRTVTTTVEGRERYGVRVRYMREERDSIEALSRVLVATPRGEQIPLGELSELRYERGPQMIRSEDTSLTAYVTFSAARGVPDTEAVAAARRALVDAHDAGRVQIPAGVRYAFAGSYENQVRTEARLSWLVPLALAAIFLLLYLQFRSTASALMVFLGVALAAAGGFLLLAAYGNESFLAVAPFGVDLRELLHVRDTRLTVAVWVGFLALFGIATDNGVIVATYLRQRFRDTTPTSVDEVHALVAEAGQLRLRPCLMTTATTGLALLPILTSGGRGADLMIPMALPTVGGIALGIVTLLTVPVLHAIGEEWKLRRG